VIPPTDAVRPALHSEGLALEAITSGYITAHRSVWRFA
jgi:hypothetical protein